ncbi:MAG: hypothetical protein ACO1OB_12045 [Archangium sp.]
MFRTVVALSLALLSCGPNLASSEEGGDQLYEGGNELATELKANVPSLTVWVKPALVPEIRDGRQVYVLRGRTSQNLDSVNSYVFDDAFGNAAVLSPRTFEVIFDSQSELNSIAAGLRMFLAFHPQSASVEPATASLTFAPTFTSPTGTTSLSVRPDVLAIAVGDQLTYRAIVKTSNGAPLTATSFDGESLPVAQRNATEWNVDMKFEQLRNASDEVNEPVTFVTTTSTGPKTKKVTLGVSVKTLELQRGDAYENWPPLQCTPAVQSCLDGLTSNDAERCGGWYPVTRCVLPWRGVQLFNTPDDVTALVNATTSINAQLPVGKSVTWRGYGLQDILRPADLPKVVNGWKAREPYGDLVNTGSISATVLRNELTAFGNAQSLITATQQVVYQQSFVAQRFERNGGKTKLYLLFFAGTARVTVLETNAP